MKYLLVFIIAFVLGASTLDKLDKPKVLAIQRTEAGLKLKIKRNKYGSCFSRELAIPIKDWTRMLWNIKYIDITKDPVLPDGTFILARQYDPPNQVKIKQYLCSGSDERQAAWAVKVKEVNQDGWIRAKLVRTKNGVGIKI